MPRDTSEKRVFQLFGTILGYPGPDLAAATQECEALVGTGNPEAAELLREFRAIVEDSSLGRMEEVYTGAFDLEANWQLYVGYHLFGESYARSIFLLELKERYRAAGFPPPEGEIPDHAAVLLSYLGVCDDQEQVDEIVAEAVLPTLNRLTGEGEDAIEEELEEGEEESEEIQRTLSSREVYEGVLQALRLILLQQQSRLALHGGASTERT
jgi:nitrate reductase delta subunit